ncbi:hypothetical protein ADK91_13880, partial [Streptomyces sp. XY511]
SLPDPGPGGQPAGGPPPGGAPAGGDRLGGAPDPIATDPAVVAELIERSRVSLAALERDIRTRSGPALFDFLLEAFEEHKRILSDPLSIQAIMAGMEATWGLKDKRGGGLGGKKPPKTNTRSPPR